LKLIKTEDRQKDYTYARAQLYNIVEKMQRNLNDAMEVAQQSEHPQSWEVVSMVLSTPLILLTNWQIFIRR
jgi:hypothetical protein